MNSGFSNLDFLKKQLLAATLASDKRFDAVIQTIGLGVAGQFEQLCNRKFARSENAQEILPADRTQFSLNRYPIENVVQYEQNQADGQGFQIRDRAGILSVDQVAGIIYFPENADLGKYYQQVRFTYTGGYWWNTLEPEDPSYSSVPPAGAFVLPAELLNVWLLQCRHLWQHLDKTGQDLLKTAGEKSLRYPAHFAMSVESTLTQFTRWTMV